MNLKSAGWGIVRKPVSTLKTTQSRQQDYKKLNANYLKTT